MIAALVMATVVISVAPGPGLRLLGHGADGNPVIAAIDHDGKIATRITCLRSAWLNPDDSAAKLIASTEIMANVIATDGHLTAIDQLGPRKYDCVLGPPDAKQASGK